jgi:hypothetical protein
LIFEGEIYAARHLKSGEPVAVKVERLNKPGNLLEEERILRNLKGRIFESILSEDVNM